MTRRNVLRAGGAGAAAWLLAGGRIAPARARPPRFDGDPFALGVASGDPRPDGVVLWTRIAPDPLGATGPAETRPLRVAWEVAHDERFRRVAARGVAAADPELAHSVHVEVGGLAPGRWYWYRFHVGHETSPVGYTRTVPAWGVRVGAATFAFASCQRFEHGWFASYRHLVAAAPDLVLHVGDYIYENPITPTSGVRAAAVPDTVRPEATDLAGYRLRHALYKTDPDLRAAHAAAPWVAILDNHDAVEDGDGDARDNLVRRAAAYQAWYEHMPVGRWARPRGASMRIHRRLPYGDLLAFNLLDTRQFRDSQDVCGTPPPNIGPACDAIAAPQRTMLGAAQERWLLDGLRTTRTRWNVLVQTVLMAHFDFTHGPGESEYLSGWDGYPAERQRLLDALSADRVRNPVVLGGDWHTSWVNDLTAAAEDPASPPVATELLAAAISSDPAFTASRSTPAVPENPAVRYYNDRNGYCLCHVDRRAWRTEFVDVADAKRPDAGAATSATWVIEDGVAGAVRA